MRATAFAAATIALAAIPLGVAHGDSVESRAWCWNWPQDVTRRAAALVQSLVARPADPEVADPEVIAPRADIDPQMAFVPPQPQGTMRIIVPPIGNRRP